MPAPPPMTHNWVVVDDPNGQWYFDASQAQERATAYDGHHLQVLFLVKGAWVRATWHDASEGHRDDEWYDNAVRLSAAEAVVWCLQQGVELPAELAKIKPGPPQTESISRGERSRNIVSESSGAKRAAPRPPDSSIDKNVGHNADVADTATGQPPQVGNLPEEVGTAQAAKILGVSKDTVLKLKASGLFEYRNTAPPDSSRSVYVFTLRSVMELRTSYERDEPAPALPKEPRRRMVRGDKKYKHLRLTED